jgi:hypothetical protein
MGSLKLILILMISCLISLPSSFSVDTIDVLTISSEGVTEEKQAESAYDLSAIGSSESFLENMGQFADDNVQYYSRSLDGGLAFKTGGYIVNLERPESFVEPSSEIVHIHPQDVVYPLAESKTEIPIVGCSVQFSYLDFNSIQPVGFDMLPGEYNFFVGGTDRWAVGVKSYSKIVYSNLYDGIDSIFEMTPDGVKNEFVVRPGANVHDIKVAVEGHSRISIDADDLVITTSIGEIRDAGLNVFYSDDKDDMIEGFFEVKDDNTFGFSIGSYDPRRTIVIDPLIYSTYLGGGLTEFSHGMRLDIAQEVYVSGRTESTDFPTTPGTYRTGNESERNVFVTKYNKTATKMIFSTYYGGSAYDYCNDIAVDIDGNIYLAGSTNSSNLPVTSDALNKTYNGGFRDGFISKLNNTGQKLLYSSFIGGNETEAVSKIDLDSEGVLYATGYSNSTDLYTSINAFQRRICGLRDIYAFKLNISGPRIVYSTYLGGSSFDGIYSMKVLHNGSLIVTGFTQSQDFPVSTNAYDNRLDGLADVIVAGLNKNGSSLYFSTFLGGSNDESPRDICIDSNGDFIIVGITVSNNFPTTSGVYQTRYKGEFDTFISRMDPFGSSLKTSTLFGTPSEEWIIGTSIALDDNGNITIAGYTQSDDFPTTEHAAQKVIGGSTDGFVSRFNPSLSELMHSSYIGGSQYDLVNEMVLIDPWTVWLFGSTGSTDFPITNDALQRMHTGEGRDSYLAKVVIDIGLPIAIAGEDIFIDQHETVKFDGTHSSDNIAITNWTWSFSYKGSDVELYGPVPQFTFDEVGIFNVNLTVKDNLGYSDTDFLTVYVNDTTPPIADAGPDIDVPQHTLVELDGSGSLDNVGIIEWLWSFSYLGKDILLSGVAQDYLFDEPGLYLVTLFVSDKRGNWANDTLNLSVLDITSPIAQITPIPPLDEHKTVEFNGSMSTDNVGIVNWTWRFIYDNGQIELYGPVAIFIFDLPGVYTLELIVKDDAGNSANDTINIIIRDITPPFADAGPDIEIEAYSTAYFDASNSRDNLAIKSWIWKFEYEGVNITLRGKIANYYFEPPGIYIVTLNVTDVTGFWSLDEVKVHVLDASPPVANAGPDTSIDQHELLKFSGLGSIDNIGIVNYTWTFEYADAPIALYGPEPDFVFDLAGTYNVTLEVSDDVGNQAFDNVIITVLDVTPPIVNAGHDIVIDQGSEVNLDGSQSYDNVGIVRWKWTFVYEGQNMMIEEAVGSFIFEVPGNYIISLFINDARGNQNSTEISVYVRDTVNPVPPALKDISVRQGDRITLDGSKATDNVGVVNWTWQFKAKGSNNMETLYGQTVDYSYETGKETEVVLTVSDADGNSSDVGFTISPDESNSLLYLMAALIIICILVVTAFVMRSRKKDGKDK